VRDLRRHAALARGGRDRVAHLLLRASVAAPALLVLAVFLPVVTRGSKAWSPAFWLSVAEGATGGGVRGQVVGTLLLVAVAGIIAAPAGLALGLVTAEYASPKASRRLRTATVTLAGVPSIVLGLAGYWLFAGQLGWGKSWLAGGIVLAVIAIPPVAVAVVGCLDALPTERREAACALGLSKGQVARDLLIPHVRPGIVTGTLLGLARAAGETAPLLFTATVFAGAPELPGGIVNAPVAALPSHVFNLIQDAADPAAVAQAWGAATVLLVIAATLLVAAGLTRRRYQKVTQP
jgi:phosphate transport system permease protein